jgi:DNA modification methylase
MKRLNDKSVDLALTDPPYNVDIGSMKDDFARFYEPRGTGKTYDNKVLYDDVIENYEEWCKKWFTELERVSKRIIFTPGNKNLHMWLDFKKPKEIMFHYKRNCISITHHVRLARYDIILAYGEFGRFELETNVYDIPINNSIIQKHKFIHPAIKEIELWRTLVRRLEPKSIIDPFMGSGTTLQVALEHGISFIGFEIDERYKVDIDKRVKLGRYIYNLKQNRGLRRLKK